MGLETASGKVLLPQIYDKILDYDEDGYVRFLKDGFYATIDLQGMQQSRRSWAMSRPTSTPI